MASLFPHIEPCPVCNMLRPHPVTRGVREPLLWRGECPRCGLLGPEGVGIEAARLLWNEFALQFHPLAGKAHRLAQECAELVGQMPPDLADLYRCCQHYLQTAAVNLRMRKQ
mgnify:CR=1 FL=1